MLKNLTLPFITMLIIALSAIINKDKTILGIKKGWKMLRKLLPQFLLLLIFVSIFLALLPPKLLAAILGSKSPILAPLASGLLGSIALIPGPIAYPLTGILKQSGVTPTILAVFITTLMMVGILTFPIEKEYLGVKVALLRNVLSFIGALIIGIAVGILV